MTRKTRTSVGGRARSNSLVVQAYLNSRQHHLTIDTGATQSIMSKNILKKTSIKLSVKCPILKTATGDQITVHAEAGIKFTALGHKEIEVTVLVADTAAKRKIVSYSRKQFER